MLSQRLGMALVADEADGLWALGPESGGRALMSAQMPDLELPDRNGRPFALRSLRGTRIVMVACASWWGCRFDLPVWQELRTELRPQGVEVVAVALETAGAEGAGPCIDAAAPEHPS